MTLGFYDGGECLRSHEGARPRLPPPARALLRGDRRADDFAGGDLEEPHRLSANEPLFVSPWGTGCSRYVTTLRAGDSIHAFWQQSQPDRSQPLVTHALSTADAARLLA